MSYLDDVIAAAFGSMSKQKPAAVERAESELKELRADLARERERTSRLCSLLCEALEIPTTNSADEIHEAAKTAVEASTHLEDRRAHLEELIEEHLPFWSEHEDPETSTFDAEYAVECAAHRIRELERERDAYRKAKAENDDRFMIERDEARERAASAERERGIYATRLAALVVPGPALLSEEAAHDAFNDGYNDHVATVHPECPDPSGCMEIAASSHVARVQLGRVRGALEAVPVEELARAAHEANEKAWERQTAHERQLTYAVAMAARSKLLAALTDGTDPQAGGALPGTGEKETQR